MGIDYAESGHVFANSSGIDVHYHLKTPEETKTLLRKGYLAWVIKWGISPGAVVSMLQSSPNWVHGHLMVDSHPRAHIGKLVRCPFELPPLASSFDVIEIDPQRYRAKKVFVVQPIWPKHLRPEETHNIYLSGLSDLNGRNSAGV